MHLRDFDFETLKPYSRIIICLRDDHAKKPGGDVDLAKSLKRLIENTGANAVFKTINELDNVKIDDVVIIFNIDRPEDAFRVIRKIPVSVRVFIYSLYHPKLGSELYIKNLSGFRGLIARVFGYNVNRYESFLEMLRCVKRGHFFDAMSSFRRIAILLSVIERCELLVVSDAELRDISSNYGPLTRPAWRLPHPVESLEAPDKSVNLRYILLAGRIEPRKNQLQLINFLNNGLLEKTGLSLIVVGGPGSDNSYYRQTIDLCHATGTVYVSHLPKDLFFKLLGQATVVINGSFVEVTSLIDLTAIKMATPVISTQYSYYDISSNTLLIDPAKWSDDDPHFVTTIEQFILSRIT